MSKIDQMLHENPLSAFSIYTQGQADYLLKLGAELCEVLESYEDVVNDFHETYGLFWLWMLGAYEVVRTLDQHSDTFEKEFTKRLKETKQHLADLRIPFAKQELRGGKGPIRAELSVIEVNSDFEFLIGGARISAKKTIKNYQEFIQSITLEQIKPNAA